MFKFFNQICFLLFLNFFSKTNKTEYFIINNTFQYFLQNEFYPNQIECIIKLIIIFEY